MGGEVNTPLGNESVTATGVGLARSCPTTGRDTLCIRCDPGTVAKIGGVSQLERPH
jgi:hypothetical protein